MQKQLFAKTLLVKLFSLALLTATFGVFALAQNAADVDVLVQKLIDAKTLPGAGIAVVRDGKVILAKGYGAADVAAGTKASEKTAFEIASVTKQFTAAGIMLLVEEGKVKLDDTLGKYLPDAPEKWRGVTVRQLLNQVSGIPNYTASGKLVPEKAYTKAEILGFAAEMKQDFEPGTNWKYSNTNYFLLGMIIEKASGKSYPDFMRKRVFKPLGMNSTLVNTGGLKIDNAASGHQPEQGSWQKAILNDPSQPFAAGAIVSTPVDMAAWALALSEGKLLKKTSWDEVWTPGKFSDGNSTDYGFGWQVRKMGETSYLAHGGGISGFTSYIVRFPNDNLSVVVLANGEGSRAPQALAFDIAGLYLPKVGAILAAQNATRNAAPIADTDPVTTKFLRETFDKMVAGTVDQNLFTAEMQKVMFPDAINSLKSYLGSQGPVKSFELLTADTPESLKRRIYRVTFQSGAKFRAMFALDAEGKIAGTNVRPE